MKSKLTKNQKKIYGWRVYQENGSTFRIKATVRYDDECRNGHNSFAITADIEEKRGTQFYECGGGSCHDEIVKHFPELKPYIKWHLMGSDGPLHYVANTVYHAGNLDCWGKPNKERDLEAARNCAVWPGATDEELSAEPDELKARLLDRLPALIEEFKRDVESLGLVF